jgi:hypothetical protein
VSYDKGTDDVRQNFSVDGPRVQENLSQVIVQFHAFQTAETLSQFTYCL